MRSNHTGSLRGRVLTIYLVMWYYMFSPNDGIKMVDSRRVTRLYCGTPSLLNVYVHVSVEEIGGELH